jgi:hypothetical protein
MLYSTFKSVACLETIHTTTLPPERRLRFRLVAHDSDDALAQQREDVLRWDADRGLLRGVVVHEATPAARQS